MDLHKEEQGKLPMMIALKGPSSSKKSEIANKLAEFLKYPLIDEDDILPNLESFLPSSASSKSINYSNDLPFKIITQISSTQLGLKLGVVINTPLSEPTHFDHLSQLSSSKKVRLVIIKCTTQIGEAHDYDVSQVSNLSIDTTKPFIVDDFVPTIFHAVNIYENSAFQATKVESNQSKGAFSRDDKINRRIFTQAHAHEFYFAEEPKVSSTKLRCNNCQELISGPTYQCIECDEFILHQSCAELYHDEFGMISKSCPFYLKSNPTEYNFPEVHKCKLCEYYSVDCNNCLLQTHIKCGLLPTIRKYEKHTHSLNFVIMPFWFSYEYKCFACDKFGKCISYKCYSCNVDVHISCALNYESPVEMTRDAPTEITQEVDHEMKPIKIIGGAPTESLLQEAYAFRCEMIKKAIGAGYLGQNKEQRHG